MKVKEALKQLRLGKLYFGTPVKIVKLSTYAGSRQPGRGWDENETLKGQTGTLTNPFVSFEAQAIGIFLDNDECCNLGLEDEIEILK